MVLAKLVKHEAPHASLITLLENNKQLWLIPRAFVVWFDASQFRVQSNLDSVSVSLFVYKNPNQSETSMLVWSNLIQIVFQDCKSTWSQDMKRSVFPQSTIHSHWSVTIVTQAWKSNSDPQCQSWLLYCVTVICHNLAKNLDETVPKS